MPCTCFCLFVFLEMTLSSLVLNAIKLIKFTSFFHVGCLNLEIYKTMVYLFYLEGFSHFPYDIPFKYR